MEEFVVVTELINRYNGYLSSAQAQDNGIKNKILRQMTELGLIDRAAHGLYMDPDIFPDPYYIAQYRCPRGVFSHETALFLHDLSDRVPAKLTMTIPSGWNSQLLKNRDILFFYVRLKWLELGVCEVETPYCMKVRVYDIERTLCDCLRCIDRLDRDLVITALKRYTSGPERDSAKLLLYSQELKMRDMVYRYLEVLT